MKNYDTTTGRIENRGFIRLGLALLVWILGIVTIASGSQKFQFQDNPRVRFTINENWKFHPGGIGYGQREIYRNVPCPIDALWESVAIPHTWNANDPFDDAESYRRGISWYRKRIALPDEYKDKHIFIYFEGVNQTADVYINGAFAGNHKGGYTAFSIDITAFVKFDGKENLIAVQVDNSHDDMIPPLAVGYALYGGIYRDVWLIATHPVHLKMTDYGSGGVFISTPVVNNEEAVVEIAGTVANFSEQRQEVNIVSTMVDDENKVIRQVTTKLSIREKSEALFKQTGKNIKYPHPWSPENPYLYTVYTEVYIDGILIDRVKNPLGCRWFSFDGDGFYLNGEKYKLKGTNRHQDFEGIGSALPNSQHVTDLEWIKSMGANFLRLAHYPQDPVVLETADRLGLLIWEEIPVVNYITVSTEFQENSRSMLREMIRQHYNHPSVIMWGSCNEVFLFNEKAERARTITNESYKSQVYITVKGLDSLIRAEDPYRYSTLAMHSSTDYNKAGIADIPMVPAWNLYSGWYSGKFEEFGRWLDKKHNETPDRPIFISEYGAGSDERINSSHSKPFDFSGNWQRLYHEAYLKQIKERPYLAGTAVWNQFDFSQPHVGGSIPHINQKGLQKWDREPKDVYYLYKANWNPEPMVHIASRDWTKRIGLKYFCDDSVIAFQTVDVYSNLAEIELFCNGKSLGKKQSDEIKKASWQIDMEPGTNVIEAQGFNNEKPVRDLLVINYHEIPSDMSKLDELRINVGFNAEFVEKSGRIWIPDQVYKKGAWGHIAGDAKMINKDLIAVHSWDLTPLFNYYLEGIQEYRIDIPDGQYEVELYFTEPEYLRIGERIFNVSINENLVFNQLDLAKKYGVNKAVSRSFITTCINNTGIVVKFEKIASEPLLCAVRVRKI